jgi:hypothetical protein
MRKIFLISFSSVFNAYAVLVSAEDYYDEKALTYRNNKEIFISIPIETEKIE